MKLQQGQIWFTDPNTHGHEDHGLYLRIVELERLSVTYKEMEDLKSGDGRHKTAAKKAFCRMLKNAELIET